MNRNALLHKYSGFTNKFFLLSIQRTSYIDKRHDNSKLSILFFVSDILQPIVMVWFIWARLLTWISCNIFACNLQRYFTVPSRVSLLYVRNASRWYVTSCLCKKKSSSWYYLWNGLKNLSSSNKSTFGYQRQWTMITSTTTTDKGIGQL